MHLSVSYGLLYQICCPKKSIFIVVFSCDWSFFWNTELQYLQVIQHEVLLNYVLSNSSWFRMAGLSTCRDVSGSEGG